MFWALFGVVPPGLRGSVLPVLLLQEPEPLFWRPDSRPGADSNPFLSGDGSLATRLPCAADTGVSLRETGLENGMNQLKFNIFLLPTFGRKLKQSRLCQKPVGHDDTEARGTTEGSQRRWCP